jgi:tetratricopeptide (TPR) repeat protein
MVLETTTTAADARLAPAQPAATSRVFVFAIATVVLAAFAAYHNTFSLPFVFDDNIVIVDNTTIRDLHALGTVLGTPHDGSGAAGRPLLNLSFALNYALGGFDVRGYHTLNLFLHTASALLLFALVRRTLLQPALREKFGAHALPIALAVSVLWAVHPLNTESVTCISQRTELLVAFFYLFTLYALVRSADATEPTRWHAVAIASCFLGMASKEVMATFPLVAFLFDRTFLAGSFREAWRRRRGLYVGLMGTWLLLGWLVLRMGGSRGVAAGFGLGVTPWSYALKQCEAIIHYLRLVVWPHPLIVDYGTDVVDNVRDVLPQGLALLALLGLTVYALVRRPMLGFFGAWFFIILGPSSSFIPLVAQTMAEHRMYLPLIAVIVPIVVGAYANFGRWTLGLWLAPAIAFAATSAHRNEVYRTELGMWQETAKQRPTNPRAHLCVGLTLMKLGRDDEAVAPLLEVLLLDPPHTTAHNALGRIFAARGWMEDAIEHFEIALQGNSDRGAIESNMCDALRLAGRLPEALQHGEEAVRAGPKIAVAHGNLGLVLAALGRDAEAIPHYEEALRLDPNLPGTHNNLSVALLNVGRLAEARDHLGTALQMSPNMAAAHNTLGAVLDRLGQKEAAIAQFEAALQIEPEFEGALRNLNALRAAPAAAEKAK